MTQDKIKRIHRCYSWGLAALLVVLGALFIASCLDIYLSGPRPYSAEAIALRFHRILIPILIGCAGVIGGIGLNILLPLERPRTKGTSSPREMMLRLRKRTGMPPVQKENRLRQIMTGVTAVIFVALLIYPAIYFMDPAHFSVSNLNAHVIRAVLTALIPSAFGLGLCWGCQALLNTSYRREAAIYKQALANGHRATPDQNVTASQKCCCMHTGIKIAVIAIAIIFIVIGIFNGGAEDVLKKAIAICTECIGLG